MEGVAARRTVVAGMGDRERVRAQLMGALSLVWLLTLVFLLLPLRRQRP